MSKAPVRHDVLVKWSAVTLLFVIHIGLLGYSAVIHTPTENEPSHLAAGISHWQFGRFDLYRVNPPLVRTIASAPVYWTGFAPDWKNYYSGSNLRCEFNVGRDYTLANLAEIRAQTTLARLACIPFSVTGGLVCYFWSSRLFGQIAGFCSLLLWLTDPFVIGHGSLISADVAAASLGVMAAYSFWQWCLSPGFSKALFAGISLGIAELTKTVWILLFIIWPILWLINMIASRKKTDQQPKILREIVQLFLILAIAFFLINAGYLFDAPFQRLGEFNFSCKSLTTENRLGFRENRFHSTLLGNLPIPLPKDYVIGVDQQLHDCEGLFSPFYLCDSWSRSGTIFYYSLGLLLKLPAGTIALLVLAVARVWCFPSLFLPRILPLLIIPACVIALLSAHTDFNSHVRYSIPALPFIYILTGALVQPVEGHSINRQVAVQLFLVVFSACSSLIAFPHSLSYFNEITGGPRNGYLYLNGSNVDWGQDVLYIERYIRDHLNECSLIIRYPSSVPFKLDSKSSLARINADQCNCEVFSVNELVSPRFRNKIQFHPDEEGVVRIGYSAIVHSCTNTH